MAVLKKKFGRKLTREVSKTKKHYVLIIRTAGTIIVGPISYARLDHRKPVDAKHILILIPVFKFFSGSHKFPLCQCQLYPYAGIICAYILL